MLLLPQKQSRAVSMKLRNASRVFQGLISDLKTVHNRFRKDQNGVAAVEFALIMPFLMILYFGAMETSRFVAVDRKMSRTSSAIADLFTQYVDFGSEEDVYNLMSMSQQIMAPYNFVPCIVLTTFEVTRKSSAPADSIDPDDMEVTVYDSIGNTDGGFNGGGRLAPEADACPPTSADFASQSRTPDTKLSEDVVPDVLRLNGAFFTMAEVSYRYRPLIGFLTEETGSNYLFRVDSTARPVLTDRIFLKPRRAEVICIASRGDKCS